MPVEMLTYADLGERLKISPEAARALVKRHRWPRSRSNDGKTLVQVDTALKQKIEALQAELIEAKAIASGHRADFERECERTNKLLAELLKTTSESAGARERAALLEGKLSMLNQPWRRRLVDAFTLALPQVAGNPHESAGSIAPSRN
jgi:hypothetical protein